ncbi:general substrate transporter [Hesseltinella vesiculosa]|uniref:General substrate transporter n=1 Tax=Hesseltinella vesiculosa TaxID=101127 RepID=A0A1X2GDQ7_9FUNG|nr:general substrate transporter [Hesseltinella vesiculosa]
MPANTISKCQGGDSGGPLPPCLPMSPYTWGYTVAAYPIGGIVGSILSKFTNARYGRRINLMTACIWMIFGNLLSAVSVNVVMYAVGRAIVGLGAGMYGSANAIYIAEITTNKTRGALGSIFESFLNLAILLSQLSGRYANYDPVWRILWAVSSVLALVQFICLFLFTVETPRRLCMEKKYDEAAASLQKLRGNADIEEEFQQLLAARQREEENSGKQLSIWNIISGTDKFILWRTVIVMVCQGYNQAGGIGPLSVYSKNIFLGLFDGDDYMASNLVNANGSIKVAATFIAIFFVHKAGRKKLMMASLLGCTLGCVLLVIGAHGHALPGSIIGGALIFTGFYSFGCGTIPWFIAPELVPLRGLASATALGSASNWSMNFLFNIVWPHMNTGLGNNAFVVFCVINFVGFLFMLFFLPETTGKSLDSQCDDREKDTETTVESSASSQGENEKKQVEYVSN